MDYPIYPNGRNKYSVAAGYNFNAALNRALGVKSPPKGRTHKNENRAPLPTIRRGPAIQTTQRSPNARVFHVPRHAANKNLYTKMRYNPKYAATIKNRLLTKALPAIDELRLTEEYMELDPEGKAAAENIIKMQYVYLPTSYEANFNENIKASVASRTAIGLPKSKSLFTPNAKENAAAILPRLLTPRQRKEVIPEILTPNVAANKTMKRKKRRLLLSQIESARAARKTIKRKTRKELLEKIKARRAAKNNS